MERNTFHSILRLIFTQGLRFTQLISLIIWKKSYARYFRRIKGLTYQPTVIYVAKKYYR